MQGVGESLYFTLIRSRVTHGVPVNTGISQQTLKINRCLDLA